VTPFSALIRLAGLSIREASEFLNIRPDTAASYATGRRTPAPGHIDELRALIGRQARAADEALDIIDAQAADETELGYPADDYEAQALGWPSTGAWGAVAARIIAKTVRVKLVPRGSTPATAAASDAHEIDRQS